jgi:ribulose bisphosphate carboxylase small subunit
MINRKLITLLLVNLLCLVSVFISAYQLGHDRGYIKGEHVGENNSDIRYYGFTQSIQDTNKDLMEQLEKCRKDKKNDIKYVYEEE